MKFTVKTAGSFKTAENAIKKVLRDGDDFQAKIELIRIAYSLVHDDRLISINVPFGEKFSLAFRYLLDIINKELKIHEINEEAPATEGSQQPQEELQLNQADPGLFQGGYQTEQIDSDDLSKWAYETEKIFENEYGKQSVSEPETIEIVDYYEILGVDYSATKEEIKKAYRKKAREFHPDISDLPESESRARMQLINEANEILRDDNSRRNYDQTLSKAKTSATKSESGTYKYPYKTQDDYKDGGSSTPPPPKPQTNKEGKKDNLILLINTSEQSRGVHNEVASKKVAKILSDYDQTDTLDLSSDTSDLADVRKAIPNLPKGEEEQQILGAGYHLFTQGIDQQGVESAVSQSDPLTAQEQTVIDNIFKVNSLFHVGAPETGNYLVQANNNPVLQILRTGDPTPLDNSILIKNSTRIVINKTKGKVSDIAKAATKKFAEKALKKGAKKVVGQVAEKGIMAALAALGVTGVGTIPALAIAAVKFIAGKILGLIKKLIKKIKPEGIVAAGLAILGFGFIGGNVSAVALGGSMVLVGGYGSAVGMMATTSAAVGLILTIAIATAFSVLLKIFIGIFGIIFLVIIITYIITTSAYVVPFSPYSLTTGSPVGPGYTSAYIDVVKTPSPSGGFENDALNGEGTLITYNISVSPRSGTLLVREMVYGCNTIKEGTNPECPPTDPSLPFSDIEFPFHINEGEAFNYSYTQRFTGNTFTDTGIRDTVTVTADADEQSGARQTASAYVSFGTPPENCPSIWPLVETIIITQGPGSPHRGPNSLDFSAELVPVFSTHGGVVEIPEFMGPGNYGSGYGNYVKVVSFCQGNEFASLYAHLQTIEVSEGQLIGPGEVVGISGDTGGVPYHLHYEFQVPPSSYVSTDYTCPIPNQNFAPYMAPPFIPNSPVAICQ